MKLIGSEVSPFVRYTRAVCAELGIEYDYHEVQNMSASTPEDLALVNKNNPAMKIPILQDGEQTILDSRIIVNYLLKKSPAVISNDFDTAITADTENHLTILYASADAALIRFIIAKTHPNVNQNEGYLQRSLERIESCITHLEHDDTFAKTFGIAELWSIFLLEWFSLRKIYDWRNHDKISALYATYKDRPSITSTRPNI